MRSPDSPDPNVTLQSDVELPDGVTEAAIGSLVRHILVRESVNGEWELGVHFVDDATMRAAHLEFMDIDEPTDIMTFPYGEDDEFGPNGAEEWADETAGGDLMISVDRAAENAESAGWSTADELLFLVAHGVLHLLGWDDVTVELRESMLARQTVLLSEWRAAR